LSADQAVSAFAWAATGKESKAMGRRAKRRIVYFDSWRNNTENLLTAGPNIIV
jgi:hypothetical protein